MPNHNNTEMIFYLLVASLSASCFAVDLSSHPSFFRSYECLNGRCQRSPSPIAAQHPSLAACRLACLDTAGLWPIPTAPFTTGSNYVHTSPANFKFVLLSDNLDEEARDFLTEAYGVFEANLRRTCGLDCIDEGAQVAVHVKVESSNLNLDWETNESYELEVSTSEEQVIALISSQTVFGARHGLETLKQLIASVPVTNSTKSLVILDSAAIRDKPVFKHRGLLIDTGRNFLPVTNILRTIDALASVKMNVLHWHATDSQSFPLEIESLPLMVQFGAYAPDKFYSTADMKMISKYAKSRGVRIIVEIDSPSHAGAGWEWGPSAGLGNLAVCVNQQPWRDYCIQPPCGQLNPVNPNTYDALRSIYRHLAKIFGAKNVIHVGGDELFVNCWNSTAEITGEMSRRGLGRRTQDFLKIWSEFHNKQFEMIRQDTANVTKSLILWSSLLTSPENIEYYLDKNKFIVQTWVEADKELNKQLIDLGYKLIISTKDAWYLDHGFWGSTKYHGWKQVYNNRIPQSHQVLGGEACMWGEYVSPKSLDVKVWPRTAAVAERLWSDPPKTNIQDIETRLLAQIDRLKLQGISTDAISPEWCNQNENLCL